MTNNVNYLLPMAGLLLSIAVMMYRKVDTRSPVCAARLNLWIFLWLFWLWADWGSAFEPNIQTVMARFMALVINLLDVKALTVRRRISIKKTLTL